MHLLLGFWDVDVDIALKMEADERELAGERFKQTKRLEKSAIRHQRRDILTKF